MVRSFQRGDTSMILLPRLMRSVRFTLLQPLPHRRVEFAAGDIDVTDEPSFYYVKSAPRSEFQRPSPCHGYGHWVTLLSRGSIGSLAKIGECETRPVLKSLVIGGVRGDCVHDQRFPFVPRMGTWRRLGCGQHMSGLKCGPSFEVQLRLVRIRHAIIVKPISGRCCSKSPTRPERSHIVAELTSNQLFQRHNDLLNLKHVQT